MAQLNTKGLALADSDVESEEEYLQEEEETEEDKKLNSFINAVRNGSAAVHVANTLGMSKFVHSGLRFKKKNNHFGFKLCLLEHIP